MSESLANVAKEKGWQQALEETYGAFNAKVAARRLGDISVLTRSGAKVLILETGRGWGAVSFRYAAMADQVVSVSNHKEYLEFARIRKEQDQISSLHLIEAQGENLSFPDHDFDLVVLNDDLGKEQNIPLDEVLRVLKTDGEICINIKKYSQLKKVQSLLKTKGFKTREMYAPLPDDQNPLYFVDLNSPEAFSFLLRSVPASRSRKKSWKRGLLIAFAQATSFCESFRLKVFRFLNKNFILISGKNDSLPVDRALDRIVRKDFGIGAGEKISYLIHSGLLAVTVVIFRKAQTNPSGIIRVVRDRSDSLKREFEMLGHIHRHASGDFSQTMPRPIGRHSLSGLDAFSMSFVEGEQKHFSRNDNLQKLESHVKKVAEWIAALNRIPVPADISRSHRFREARERIHKLAIKGNLSGPMAEIVDRILNQSDEQLDLVIPAVITHRDLGDANILCHYEELRIIDWGNCHYGYPLTDWMRFFGYFLAEINSWKGIAPSWRQLLLGQSPLSPVFYDKTNELCRINGVAADWKAPLFLLSLFDFLEGFHYYGPGGWEEEFGFLFSEDRWISSLAETAS